MSGMVFPSTASERVMRAAIERVGSDDVVAVINGEVGVGTTTTVDSDHTLSLSLFPFCFFLHCPVHGLVVRKRGLLCNLRGEEEECASAT